MFERHYDLVVAGGGVAGIAAAIAGARRGLKTILLEKTVLTGGLATTGIVNIYLPLCDGNGTQVSYGITEEMLKRSLDYGPGEIPDWRNQRDAAEQFRYRTVFSPASFTLALDEMLEEAGVDLWLDTLVIGASVEDGRLCVLTVANKSGMGTIHGRNFVDATGDSDLAVFAGAKVQCAANALACWTVEYMQGSRELAENCRIFHFGTNCDPNVLPPGVSGHTVTRSVLDGRKVYREHLKKEYAKGSHNRNTLFPLKFPAMADLRHTRCFDAPFTLVDGMEWTRFDDSIGLAADWRKPGFVWEIPYRTMLSRQLRGLLAAGRCTASLGDAWEVTRVIPVAAMTGEAAGVAAALACAKDTTPDQIPASEVAAALNWPVHFDELGLSRNL